MNRLQTIESLLPVSGPGERRMAITAARMVRVIERTRSALSGSGPAVGELATGACRTSLPEAA